MLGPQLMVLFGHTWEEWSFWRKCVTEGELREFKDPAVVGGCLNNKQEAASEPGKGERLGVVRGCSFVPGCTDPK